MLVFRNVNGNCTAGYLEKENHFHGFVVIFHKVSTEHVLNLRRLKFQMVIDLVRTH